MERPNAWKTYKKADLKKVEQTAAEYRRFLDNGKTERLCVQYCIKLAEERGFKAYKAGMKLKTGDKVYFNNRGKSIMLAVIGKEGLEKDLAQLEYYLQKLNNPNVIVDMTK